MVSKTKLIWKTVINKIKESKNGWTPIWWLWRVQPFFLYYYKFYWLLWLICFESSDYDFSDFSAEEWPLMKSPIYPILILVSYWYFVFKLGPKLMKNRAPFDISKVLIAYNAYQVIVSSWFCILFFGLENPFETVINSLCGGLKKNEIDYVK